MPREPRSGPRKGVPLSHCLWQTKTGVLRCTYEGSLNELLLSAFRRPRRMVDALPRLVKAYQALGLPPTSQPARTYVAMRLYELKRRDLFIITEPA